MVVPLPWELYYLGLPGTLWYRGRYRFFNRSGASAGPVLLHLENAFVFYGTQAAGADIILPLELI